MRQNKYEYDAFISHAVEDKIPIANELCAKLERAGLKIWYSGKELGVGDSIEKTIEKGLNRSRYGIVVFSPTYLAKNWTIREFYTLLAKEIEEQKVILPVLFNISLDELKNKDLVMADRFAVNADKGIDFVVERLVREIRKSQPVKVKEAWFSKIWLMLVLSLLANVALVLKGTFNSASVALNSTESFDRGAFSASPVHQGALLAEMQGLFDRLNACKCNCKEEQPPRFSQTGLVRIPAASGESSFYKEKEPSENGPYGFSQGSKVTMAVVLQIEAHPTGKRQMEEEINELLNTISPPEKEDPFVEIASLENASPDANRQCTHAHHTGE